MLKPQNIIIYNILLSIVMGTLLIWLLPPLSNKYAVKLIKKATLDNPNRRRVYYDLNSDANSEEILRGHNTNNNRPFLAIHDQAKYYLTQLNARGEWVKRSPVMAGDFDHNGFGEVFSIVFDNDSMFMYGFEPYLEDGLRIEGEFVSETKMYDGKHDWTITSNDFIDLNGDGYDEIVFSIMSGFVKYPRKVFAYDLYNDTIWSTPDAGNTFEWFHYLDLDNNGVPEIAGYMYAVNNYKDTSILLHDSNSYLLLLDNHLDFLVDPIPNKGPATRFCPYPFNDKLLVRIAGRTKENHFNYFKLFDFDTSLFVVKETDFMSYFDNIPFPIIYPEKNEDVLLLVDKTGKVIFFNKKLEATKKKKLRKNLSSPGLLIDMENDGEKEILLFDKPKNLAFLYRRNFKHSVTLDIQCKGGDPIVSTGQFREENSLITIQFNDLLTSYEYFPNPTYPYRYFIYTGIYLGVFVFFYLLFLFYRKRLMIQFENEKKLSALQLRAIKNQMDPHFTLNILNAIGSLIGRQELEKANYLFTRYSKLTRDALIHSDKISIALKEELGFVRDYLILEKFRNNDKVEYKIDVDEDVDLEILIPKMLIHTFIENAVKHGIRHLEKDGKISIKVKRSGALIYITIEDNGVGRMKASEFRSQSTGKGMGIASQIVSLYNKMYGTSIAYEIIDVTDENGEAKGTKAIIRIPSPKPK